MGVIKTTILSVLLVVAVVIGAILISRQNGSSGTTNNTSTTSATSTTSSKTVAAICAPTQHKDACLSSMKSVKPDASIKDYIEAAVKAIVVEVKKAFNETDKVVVDKDDDPFNDKDGIKNCKDFFLQTLDQLDEAISQVGQTDIHSFEQKSHDFIAWLTGANIYIQTCVGELGKPEYKSAIQNGTLGATQLVENGLYIFSKIKELIGALDITDTFTNFLNGNETTSNDRSVIEEDSSFPSWVSKGDRKLLMATATPVSSAITASKEVVSKVVSKVSGVFGAVPAASTSPAAANVVPPVLPTPAAPGAAVPAAPGAAVPAAPGAAVPAASVKPPAPATAPVAAVKSPAPAPVAAVKSPAPAPVAAVKSPAPAPVAAVKSPAPAPGPAFPVVRVSTDLGTIIPNVVVAKDGSGQFKTITEAVNTVPDKNTERFIIYIKAATYNEIVQIQKKHNLFLLGDGIGKTIITGNQCNKLGFKTSTSATVGVDGDFFMARGITFENTAGPDGHQAVALRINGEKAVVYECEMTSYQDTLYYHKGLQFYKKCIISGTVDFIFGGGRAFIQDSTIIARLPGPSQGNMITADGGLSPVGQHGLVIQNCKITAEPQLMAQKDKIKTYLGRPWKPYAVTTYMSNEIGDFITPEGYAVFGVTGPEAQNSVNAIYNEYMNTGPGANSTARDTVSFKHFKLITSQEALAYTVGKYIDGPTWLPASGVPYKAGL